jgi:hypothetical protein
MEVDFWGVKSSDCENSHATEVKCSYIPQKSLISYRKKSAKNWHQICSTVKFAEQNSMFLRFLGGICMGGTLRMSNFKMFSIFSGSRFLVPNIVTKNCIRFVLR